LRTGTTIDYRGGRLRLPVYLDYQATTPVDPRVLEAMLPYFSERFGNPHSVHHAYGWEADEAVEIARTQVARLIGARAGEIVFTSGATESNNLAILGAVPTQAPATTHLVTCVTEHRCVLECFRALERRGHSVTYLAVQETGLIDLGRLAAAIREDTALVSVMAVNHEIGVIQPIDEIGRICASRGVMFHCDAAQAAGKIRLDVAASPVDMMSLSGHKLYAPKGIGALYLRQGMRPAPLILGGGQERGLRSGTLPTPLCVGLGAACELAGRELAEDAARIRRLRDRLHDGIATAVAGVRLNGDPDRRIPGNLNLGLPTDDIEDLIADWNDLAVSTGSACTSASREPSYVLRALGRSDEAAHNSVRFGIGRGTTEAEIDYAIERVAGSLGDR
jgi:cysteine desulfurase